MSDKEIIGVHFRENVNVFLSETSSKLLQNVDLLKDPNYRGWTVVETPVGVEVTPASGYSTVVVPWAQIFKVLKRPVKAEKPAKK